jgi:hypothetical protein
MADRKISDLTALTAPAAGDYLPIVDISEASAANKNKRITIEELLRGAPDGTAAAPSIGFESDPNTGIYRPGADQVAISTGGTEHVRIDSSGRLLVGTSSALTGSSSQYSKLAVQGNSANAFGGYFSIGYGGAATGLSAGADIGTINFTDTGAGQFAQIRCDTDATTSAGDFPGRLVFSTTADSASSPTERMRIDSAGNVGIGTTSPTQRLHVAGTINVSDGDFTRTTVSFDATNGLYINNTDNTPVRFGTTNTERLRIDAAGRLLVGTSSARDAFFSSGTSARLQIEGSGADSFASLTRNNNDAGAPILFLAKSRGTGNTTVQNGDEIGRISFQGNDGSGFEEAALISVYVDGEPNTSGDTTDMPGRLVFSTTADGASSPTEALRITSAQDLMISQSGSGLFVGTTADGAYRIGRSSFAVSSGTLYIGNAAIQVSSDVRLKKDIEDTNLDALAAISKIKVKDFTWDDPTDTSYNNRNARGKWTGLIAQELIEVLPFVVNAPRKEEDGSIDHDSESVWTLDQSQLCPVLIKAIQQQQEIIANLEARLSALEAA